MWHRPSSLLHLGSARCRWPHSFVQRFAMCPASPSRLSQAYSQGACGKAPQSSKRGKLHCTLLNPLLISCWLMSLSAKVSHTAKPRCKGWGNRFHLLMREDAESRCKGTWVWGGEGYGAMLHILPESTELWAKG